MGDNVNVLSDTSPACWESWGPGLGKGNNKANVYGTLTMSQALLLAFTQNTSFHRHKIPQGR